MKITPCSRATKLVNFKIISTLSNESWNKILPSLSQAFTSHHPNVFTPILPLSEGQAGIAWVPFNKMLSFPLRYKAPLAFDVFSLLLLLYYPFWLSLSLFGFKGLMVVFNAWFLIYYIHIIKQCQKWKLIAGFSNNRTVKHSCFQF
jgi:hypothetical protein